jgi:hypothetical protein
MTSATIEREAGRGRQPAAVEARRDTNDDIRAERLEAIELARRCVALGTRLEGAGKALGSPTVMQAGLELGYAGSRFLRQRSSGVL